MITTGARHLRKTTSALLRSFIRRDRLVENPDQQQQHFRFTLRGPRTARHRRRKMTAATTVTGANSVRKPLWLNSGSVRRDEKRHRRSTSITTTAATADGWKGDGHSVSQQENGLLLLLPPPPHSAAAEGQHPPQADLPTAALLAQVGAQRRALNRQPKISQMPKKTGRSRRASSRSAVVRSSLGFCLKAFVCFFNPARVAPVNGGTMLCAVRPGDQVRRAFGSVHHCSSAAHPCVSAWLLIPIMGRSLL